LKADKLTPQSVAAGRYLGYYKVVIVTSSAFHTDRHIACKRLTNDLQVSYTRLVN